VKESDKINTLISGSLIKSNRLLAKACLSKKFTKIHS